MMLLIMDIDTKKSRYKVLIFMIEAEATRGSRLQREPILIWMMLNSVIINHSISLPVY